MQGLRIFTRSGAAPTAEEIDAAHIVANTHKEMRFGTINQTEQTNGVEVEYHAHKNMAFVSGGSVFGGSYEAPFVAWRGKLTDVQILESLPNTTRSLVLRIPPGGKVAYGSSRGTYYRAVFWGDDGSPIEVVAEKLINTAVPNGGLIPYLQSDVRQVSADGKIALMQMSANARLFPRTHLWEKDTGARDLGFLTDIDASYFTFYPYSTSNVSHPVDMSDDGTVVFANHGIDTYFSGGYLGIGAIWKEQTGWVRIPPPAGYIAKAPGLRDLFIHDVTIYACSADGKRLAGYVSSANLTSPPEMPVIWEEGIGTRVLPTVSGFNPTNTFPVSMSRSGEFVLLVDQVASTVTVWSEKTGLVVTSLYGESPFSVTQYAVDDNGVAYGRVIISGKGYVARCSLDGATTIYEIPDGAIGSRVANIGKKYTSGWCTGADGNNIPVLWDLNGKLISIPDAPPGFQIGFSYITHVPDTISPMAWLIR